MPSEARYDVRELFDIEGLEDDLDVHFHQPRAERLEHSASGARTQDDGDGLRSGILPEHLDQHPAIVATDPHVVQDDEVGLQGRDLVEVVADVAPV